MRNVTSFDRAQRTSPVRLYRLPILITLLAACAGFAAAQGVPLNCSTDFTTCYIPKNVPIVSPALVVFSGDAVLQKANSTEAAALFRVNNDYVNTTRGTGLGMTLFLYSVDGAAPLPNPSSYSANVQNVSVAASGPTSYTGAYGFPTYQLDLDAAPVTVQYTGVTRSGLSSSVQLSAVVTSGGGPVAGGMVYFSLGSQSCNAQTDVTGKAVCAVVLNQHQGNYSLAAAFAGIFGQYAGGSDTKSFVVTGQ
jgi:hypothetical protein